MGNSDAVRLEKIDVGGQVDQIAMSFQGRIFATTTEGRLVCFDLTGVRSWERRWISHRHSPLPLRVSGEGRPWVGVNGAITGFDHDGRNIGTITFACGDQERLGSFLLAPEGYYGCLHRPGASGASGPRVVKLDPSGSTIWSTILPVGVIGYSGVVETGVRTGWETKPKPPWSPRTWEPLCYQGAEPLLLSGNRLLASFFEFPRSGIGCTYGLDAESGELLWVTEPAPTHTLAIAGMGRFFQGLQGYGAFETRLLGPDGIILQRWESHGYPVIDGSENVRSVEMENSLPSRMRFVTLQDDGGVGNGPLLEGYYTTYPVISHRGVVAFWRNGELVLISDQGEKDVIFTDSTTANQGVMSRMLLASDGSLIFSLGHELWIVGTELGPLAQSPWPCGSGNIQNNPVWA